MVVAVVGELSAVEPDAEGAGLDAGGGCGGVYVDEERLKVHEASVTGDATSVSILYRDDLLAAA